jgi:hypothetical protein
MKKNHYKIILTFLCFLTAQNVMAQTSATEFAGTWVLDKTKTKMQDLPRQFKGYTITVVNSEGQVGIKNVVDGKIEPQFENRGSSVGRMPSAQESIWGDSRQATTSGLTVKPNYGGSMALSNLFTPSRVAYNLDGKETNIDILQNGEVVGSAKTKAKIEKDGKSMKVATVRRMKTLKAGQTEMIIYVRERWEVLEDGKSLRYVKTVELPAATDEVTLYFLKEEKTQ